MTKRFIFYMIGLYIMTIGIGFSIKADLGVSPVSSVPYTITLIIGIEMGKATILFHIFLVFLQVLLLRKEFELKHLAQVPVGVMFGYFTTLSNYLTGLLPSPEHIAFKLLFLLISIVLVAIGLLLYMPPDVIPLAGEGAMLAISGKTGIAFPKVKIGFDVTVVLISGIVCLTVMHRLGSVGIGTLLAAVLVGVVLNFISGRFRERYLRFLAAGDTKVGAPEFENE
jgi:uncharacterized membrane protein YczE